MKMHQYRCNKCLILEERLLAEGRVPLCSVPCSLCGGLAIKLPTSESLSKIFGELGQMDSEQNPVSSLRPQV